MSYVLTLAILIGIVWLFVALRRQGDHNPYARHDPGDAPTPPSGPTGRALPGGHAEAGVPSVAPPPTDDLVAIDDKLDSIAAVPPKPPAQPPPPTITERPQRQSLPRPKARKLVRPAPKAAPAARAAEPPVPTRATSPPAAPAPRSIRSCRIIAIDWSGDARDPGKKIWLAEAQDGQLSELRNGLDYNGIIRYLRSEAERGPLVVGLDFAFSFPGWFIEEQGFDSAPALWAAMHGGLAERWLGACNPPFFGRPGKRRPAGIELYRETEKSYRADGYQAKSVFQIGGAGAVGTGSVRGMPVLHRLRRAGFAVWPFEPASDATLVEIYPRALTGAVVKSDAAARSDYLARNFPELESASLRRAASNEDAFDAAVSALAMWKARDELGALPEMTDAAARMEGAIWAPGCR